MDKEMRRWIKENEEMNTLLHAAFGSYNQVRCINTTHNRKEHIGKGEFNRKSIEDKHKESMYK